MRLVGLCWFTLSDEETKKQQMPLAQIREATATCNLSPLFSGGAFGRIDLKCWIQQAESTNYVMECVDGNYTDAA